MSVVVFSKSIGNVSSFEDPTLPGRVSLRVENWGGFSGFKAIFTRVMVSQQCNYQFLHTLGGSIYVYVFGDRIGQLALSGLAFDNSCESDNSLLGIERVIQYYNQNRLTNRRIPLRVTIGAATTLVAYLAAINLDVADPKTQIYQFTLNMMLVPPLKNKRPERDEPVAAAAGDAGFVTSAAPTVDSGDGVFPDLPTAADYDSPFGTLDTGGAVEAVEA